jgi:pyruvate,water dikinase
MNMIEFTEPEVALETAGGKGLNLARTTQAGLPVPQGFIIPTAAYRRFIAENHLEDALRAFQASVNAAQSESDGSAVADLNAAFTRAVLPTDLRQAIAAAYQRLCAAESQPDLPVAVRSSATAEDLSGASFAGQQETYLNIRGEAALIDAVQLLCQPVE